LLPAEAEAVHHAGSEALDQDISFIGQAQHNLEPLGVLDIGREAADIAVAE
jgi:hypothetical protein